MWGKSPRLPYHNEETQIMCKGLKWWYDCKAEKEKRKWIKRKEKKEGRNEEGQVTLSAGPLEGMLPLTETSDHSILSLLFPHFLGEIVDFGTCKSALKSKVYWVLLPSENISVLLLWSTVSSTDILKKAFEKASSKSNGPKIKLESSISMATCLPCALYRTTLQTLTELRMDILGGELCRPLYRTTLQTQMELRMDILGGELCRPLYRTTLQTQMELRTDILGGELCRPLYRTTLQTLTELRTDILGGELCRPLYRTTLQTLTELRTVILGGELCRPLGHEDRCCWAGPLCWLNQRMFIMNRVQFVLVQDGIYVLGKTHMHATPSLRSCRQRCLWNSSNVCLIDDSPFSSFWGTLSVVWTMNLQKLSPTLPLKQFQC